MHQREIGNALAARGGQRDLVLATRRDASGVRGPRFESCRAYPTTCDYEASSAATRSIPELNSWVSIGADIILPLILVGKRDQSADGIGVSSLGSLFASTRRAHRAARPPRNQGSPHHRLGRDRTQGVLANTMTGLPQPDRLEVMGQRHVVKIDRRCRRVTRAASMAATRSTSTAAGDTSR